jgi:hypothetical protein
MFFPGLFFAIMKLSDIMASLNFPVIKLSGVAAHPLPVMKICDVMAHPNFLCFCPPSFHDPPIKTDSFSHISCPILLLALKVLKYSWMISHMSVELKTNLSMLTEETPETLVSN